MTDLEKAQAWRDELDGMLADGEITFEQWTERIHRQVIVPTIAAWHAQDEEE